MKKSLARFIIIWLGQLISNIGNGMTAFALGINVFQNSGSAIEFSFVLLCQFLPAILFRPLGGVLADSFSRRTMIIIGDLGSALGVLFILFSLSGGELVLWKIYLGIAFSSAFVALQNPAYKAIVSDMVVSQDYARVSGLVQLASSAQHLLSPILAGILLTTGSLSLILYIDIASFFFAVIAVLVIGKAGKVKTATMRFWSDLWEGWKLLLEKKQVFFIVIIVSVVTFFVGIIQTLLTPMLLTITSPKNVGLVQSISASGMLISSLLIGVISFHVEMKRVLIISMFLAGIFMSLLGISTSLIFITVVFFLFFCTLPFINTGAEVIIRRSIVTEGQGRVWGIIGFLSQLGYLLAYLLSGWLAEKVFNPFMNAGGKLATSLRILLGQGPGRGMGLMLILAGLSWIGLALSSRIKFSNEEKKGVENVNL
ncbi:MFS transporter [bacterium]|nr:MFS transporter [bacterium]